MTSSSFLHTHSSLTNFPIPPHHVHHSSSIFSVKLWNQLCKIQLKSLHFSLRNWFEGFSITLPTSVQIWYARKAYQHFPHVYFRTVRPPGGIENENERLGPNCLWQPAYCILNWGGQRPRIRNQESGICQQEQQAATIVLSARPEGHLCVCQKE